MIYFISILNTTLFLLIAGVHVFWAFGGRWGAAYAVPSDPSGSRPVFNPGIIPTLVVAFGLLLFALVLLSGIGLVRFAGFEKYKQMALLAISGIFLIRAVGEFRYVGLTRKVKNTKFAIYDAHYFTPLCIWLGVSILILAFNTIP